MSDNTKNLIQNRLEVEKVDFDRRKYKTPKERPTEEIGAGVKTKSKKSNYITLPCDPVELAERLELLSGSKDAGNTGVYNETVAIS